jgi:flagellar biosynthesis/type III secretory pathway protein FliH
MAQLFKGHIVNSEPYPMPTPAGAVQPGADQHAPQAPVVDAADLQRAAGDLEQIVHLVQAMRPTVEQMHASVHAGAQQQGYNDGLARAQAEVQAQLVEALAAVTAAQNERHRFAQEQEQALADLALKIARKVIGAHLEADPAIVARIVESTVGDLEPTTSLKVRVHPEDVHFVEQSRAELERMVAGPGTIEILGDLAVERGGVVLESPVGEVDARIETKLAVLETAFAAQRRSMIGGPTVSGGGPAGDDMLGGDLLSVPGDLA